MKILIIGGVAAGTKAAAKLKREDIHNDVTIITKGKHISYAGCGLPYYVGGIIEDKAKLIVNTPESFEKSTGVKVLTEHEATAVDTTAKTVSVTHKGECFTMSYDKLVIASGARPMKFDMPGIDLDGVYFMRTPDDAIALREKVQTGEVKRAGVIGGGFIGLEIAENLAANDIRVSVVEMAPHIMPGFDEPFAEYAENHLADKGIMVFTGDRLLEIMGDGKVEKIKTEKRAMKADVVVMSVGIRPNTEFLKDSGVELNERGTVKVNEYFETSAKDVYAVGDCIAVFNEQTEAPAWSPMGSSANIEGRLCAQNMMGKRKAYKGVVGTAVVKLPGLSAGRTGLSESAAKALGIDAESVTVVVDSKAHYYPDASLFIIKLVCDKNNRKILGVQVMGDGAVDKITDIVVMAINSGATLDMLEDSDFAYAPPFSTAIHPLVHAANVLENKLKGQLESITPDAYLKGSDRQIVDVSITPAIEGVPYLNLAEIQPGFNKLDTEKELLLVCTKGKRAYLAQNRLKALGYKNTKVLEGGTTFNRFED